MGYVVLTANFFKIFKDSSTTTTIVTTVAVMLGFGNIKDTSVFSCDAFNE